MDERSRGATWALLYSPDAGPFDRPLAALRLPLPHELPPVGVGGVVEVTGLGDDVPSVVAGGLPLAVGERVSRVTLISADPDLGPGVPLWSSSLPGFAEGRGGPVVVHPDFGATSQYSWSGRGDQHLGDGCTQTSHHWMSKRRALWAGLLGSAAIVAFAIGARLGALLGLWDYRSGSDIFVAIMAAAVIPHTWRLLQRRRRVGRGSVKLDDPNADVHQMRMRLWFASGDDLRPVTPWVTLYPMDGSRPVASLPVLDVPHAWRPEPGTPCRVRGRPAPDEVVTVSVESDGTKVELRPADTCTDRVTPAQPELASDDAQDD